MREDMPSFMRAKRAYGLVDTMYAELIHDPDAPEDRKSAAKVLRSAMPRGYTAADGMACNVARLRILEDARTFFGDPTINIP
ncbi:MAG: hypothetical protein INR70_26740 [Parafilimonas terrae]|nr:hypothetical protein [Parafilimonas terrae]